MRIEGDCSLFVEASHVLLLLSDFSAEVFGQTQHLVVDCLIIIGTAIVSYSKTINFATFL